MHLNRSALCSIEAQQTARLLLAGRPVPPELSMHIGAANVILTAFEQGWFVLPAWQSGHYSRTQFESIRRQLERHPAIPGAIAVAEDARRHALATFPGQDFELFGSRNTRLPCPVVMAKIAAYSCPRLPFEFRAKSFTAHDLCDWIEDVGNNCRRAVELSKLLCTPGLLDPLQDMQPKLESLAGTPMACYIEGIVCSVHSRFLSRDEARCLSDVSYGRRPAGAFVELLKRNEEERARDSNQYWKRIRRKVAGLAGLMAEVESYSHASLTKRLRSEFGPRYQVCRTKNLDYTRYVVEIDEAMPLGHTSHAASPFELANWVIALDNKLPKVLNSVGDFYDACKSADAAITRMRGGATAVG